MRLLGLLLTAACGLLLLAGPAQAETRVELKGVHLCCPGCAKAVIGIVGKIEGVKAKCDIKKKTVTLTAPDKKTAQEALDALAKGGFFGETGDEDLVIKPEKNVPSGKVKSLKVTGVHNCCGACCRSIKAAVKKVEGVSGDTAQPKKSSFEVRGDFDAADLVKALQAAGFHARVEP